MLNVKIATPSEKVFEGELERITIKTTDGVITILPNHIPFISTIENGYVKYNDQELTMTKGAIVLDGSGNLEVLGY